jgi:calcineurin-like phosphoesterase
MDSDIVKTFKHTPCADETMLQKLATEIYQKAAGQCTFQESAIAEESAAEAKRVECDVREIFSICSKIPTIGAKIY